MPDQPLAYFITFTTYGTWLHGKEAGSVDDAHSHFSTPFLPANPSQEAASKSVMSQPPYRLDSARRAVVLKTIQEVCRYRGWRLLACHVRTNHCHFIVRAECAPEKVMNDCKAYASRRLTETGLDERTRRRWTEHGSTRYLWDEERLREAILYVLERQGDPMEIFRDDDAIADCLS